MDSASTLGSEPAKPTICYVCQGFGDMLNPRGAIKPKKTKDPDIRYVYTYMHYNNIESLFASAERGCRLCDTCIVYLRNKYSDRLAHMRAQFPNRLNPGPHITQSDGDNLEASGLPKVLEQDRSSEAIERRIFGDTRVVLEMECHTESGPRACGRSNHTLSVSIVSSETGSLPRMSAILSALIDIYDPLDANGEHRPCKDLLSEPHMSLINRWIHTCQTEHTGSCSDTISSQPLPTRILELSGPSGNSSEVQVRLVETHSKMQGTYACLSYCWGGSQTQIGRTVHQNLSTHLQAIPLHNLPDTVRDAVYLCQKLGYHYLWVDRLCIIQDDEQDWKKEASRMCDVYSRSALTISVPMCGESSESFLAKRRYASRFKEIKGEAILKYKGGRIYFGVDVVRLMDDGSTFLEGGLRRRFCRPKTPWLGRGWTFQEWMLSPRVLHIHGMTLWDCFGGYANEMNRRYTEKPILERDSKEIGVLGGISWDFIVSEYSARETTYKKDRLPALAGLASRFHQRTGYTYLAGLWREELPLSLLWCQSGVAPFRSPIQEATQTTSMPTWSWAAVDRAVNYWSHKNFHATATIVSDWRQGDLSNSFIEVGNAWIDIEGYMSAVINVKKSGPFKDWCQVLVGNTWWPSLPDHENGYLDEDIARCNLYLLDIGWQPTQGRELDSMDIRALVLQRVDGMDDSRQCFRRVGIAYVKPPTPGPPNPEFRLKWKRRIVRLV